MKDFCENNSPLARSPILHTENSVNQQIDKLSNSVSCNGLVIPSYSGQRSRHHNSVKYCNSANISTRIKTKSIKDPKSKKKVSSYQKLNDGKSSKNHNNRSPNPHYEIIAKNSNFKNISVLNASKMTNQSNINGFFNQNQANENNRLVDPKKDQNNKKSRSRERTHLSQERIQKRENGK